MEQKSLLTFSAYYEPEVAASLYLSTNLYEDFAKAGWKVNLFVPMPTRGVDGKTRNYYKTHKKEQKGDLTIHRVSLMKEGKNSFGRAVRYLLMNLAFIWKSVFTKADVVFVQSTPPTQGAMAAIIKKIKRIPFVYNLQDVFPDSMVGMGLTIKGSFIYKVGRVVENFTYRNADHIIVISNDMKRNIMKKRVPENKIKVVHNWIDTEQVKPVDKKENYLFEKYQIPRDKFNVVYAGNLGYAQNIEVILKAAKQVEGNEDINFVIFGRGAQEEEYKKMAMDMHLKNLVFLPIQPYSEVPYVYSLGDAAIVSCKKGFGGSAMPSKTWSILACGTPVLASFDKGTDMETIIRKEKIGLFSDVDDLSSLTDNILRLNADLELREQCGMNARVYVEGNADRKACTQKYLDMIMETVRCRK